MFIIVLAGFWIHASCSRKVLEMCIVGNRCHLEVDKFDEFQAYYKSVLFLIVLMLSNLLL